MRENTNHSMQRNDPTKSSGFESDVLVTVPTIVLSTPICSVDVMFLKEITPFLRLKRMSLCKLNNYSVFS